MKSKNKIIQIGKFVLATIVSLGILNVFVQFYSFSGVHITNKAHATDYTWESKQIKRTLDEGFAYVQMDELGYNNSKVLTSIDYLIMGSSNVEAVNVETNDNFVSLLNNEFQNINFYNIGISGHQIYNCVNNLESAIETFSPKQAIILITDSVELDNESMKEVIDGKWKRIPSYDTGMLFYIQKKAPVIKTLYKKVLDWKDLDVVDVDINDIDFSSNEYLTNLQEFLSFAKKNVGDIDLIIVYQPSTKIDSSGELIEAQDPYALEVFEETCKNNNIKFVDMTDDFKKLYEDEHILAHGFTNTAVGTGHLNRYGHQVIARRLSKLIKEEIG